MSISTEHEDDWLQTPLGDRLLIALNQQLGRLLPTLFGYYLLVIANPACDLALEYSKILRKFWLFNSAENPRRGAIQAHVDELPIASDNIDLIIFQNTLDSSSLSITLSEISRALTPNGHLIIWGFNRWSLLSLKCYWQKKITGHTAWPNNFHSMTEIKKLLPAANLNLIEKSSFFFRPPFEQSGKLKHWRFMEVLGSWLWPSFGTVYIILARKDIVSLTPIRVKSTWWQTLKKALGESVPSHQRFKKHKD